MLPKDSTTAPSETTPTQPVDPNSQQAPVQPSSPGEAPLTRADLENFGRNLIEQFRRTEQGVLDKGTHSLKRQVRKLDEKIQPLLERAASKIASGATVQDALSQVASEEEEVEFRQAVIDLRDGNIAGRKPPEAGGGPSALTGDDAEIIATLGLDGNSAEVNEILRNEPNSVLRIAKLGQLQGRSSQPATPSPAAAAPLKSGPAPKSTDPRLSKVARLNELQEHPSVNKFEIQKLTKELDAEGWPD